MKTYNYINKKLLKKLYKKLNTLSKIANYLKVSYICIYKKFKKYHIKYDRFPYRDKLHHFYDKHLYGNNHPAYKHGRYSKKLGNFCKDCHKRISPQSRYCHKCHSKGKRNGMYNIHRFGKNNPNYIHGKAYEPYLKVFNNYFKLKIKTRDKFKCQLCKITEKQLIKNKKRKLFIHHIDYNKKNCNKKNLITLCNKCHSDTNNDRDYWFAYFTYIMENK